MAIFNSGNFMSVSDPLNFSQEERVVGFWIDGRSIYQKTVAFEGYSMVGDGDGTVIPEFGSDIKKLIHVFGTTTDGTYFDFSINRGHLKTGQIFVYLAQRSNSIVVDGWVTAWYIKEDLPA